MFCNAIIGSIPSVFTVAKRSSTCCSANLLIDASVDCVEPFIANSTSDSLLRIRLATKLIASSLSYWLGLN